MVPKVTSTRRNLARQDQPVGIVEADPHVHRAGAGRDLGAQNDQLALPVIGRAGFQDQPQADMIALLHLARFHPVAHAQHSGTGIGHVDIDRIQPRDRGQRRGLVCRDQRPHRHLGLAGDTGNGAGDRGMVQVDLRRCQIGLRRRQRGLGPRDRRLGGFQRGCSGRAALQGAVTARCRAGGGKLCLGARNGRTGRSQRGPVGRILDPEHRIAGLQRGARLIEYLDDGPADARADVGLFKCDRAPRQGADIGHILDLQRNDAHLGRPPRPAGRPALRHHQTGCQHHHQGCGGRCQESGSSHSMPHIVPSNSYGQPPGFRRGTWQSA